MINLAGVKKVLTVFAHPDDETLAAGATMAKLSSLGAEVHVMIPATGVYARRNVRTESEMAAEIKTLKVECATALAHLGVKGDHIIFGEFPDNEMDSVSLLSVIHWMQTIFDDVKPDLVLTHHKECTNVDHQVCFEAVTVLTRPGLGSNIPVLCGEVPSSTGYRRPTMFEPNFYVDVTEQQVRSKIKSMQAFSNEARPDPHPRSPEVLHAVAKVRGSEAGFYFAEAFMLLRAFG